MSNVTLDGVNFDASDFLNYGYLEDVVVDSVAYERFIAMFVAGLRDIDAGAFAAGSSASGAVSSAANAATSASNAATSESNAATSASNAATSASNAATSEANAAASAAAATGGSVKVSSNDTAESEFLNDKLAVAGGLAKSVQNGGGDESLQLSGSAFLQKDGSVAATGNLDMNGNAVKKSALAKASNATVTSTSTRTFNFNNGAVHKVTTSGSITMTLAASNFPSGKGAGIIIEAVNWGSITAVSIPSAWKFAGGSAPSFTAAGTDRLILYKDADNGYTLHVVAFDVKAA